MLSFQLHPVGDCALLAEFAQRIAPDIGAAVAALSSRVLAAKLPGVVETVPAFASLLITYDPLVTEYDTIADAVKKLADADGADTAAGEGRLVTIPVCYGGDFGPDLPFVAQHAGLTEEEVIALHAGREYQIYMLGFYRGFHISAVWMNGCSPRGWERPARPSRPGRWESAASRPVFIPLPARAAGS